MVWLAESIRYPRICFFNPYFENPIAARSIVTVKSYEDFSWSLPTCDGVGRVIGKQYANDKSERFADWFKVDGKVPDVLRFGYAAGRGRGTG